MPEECKKEVKQILQNTETLLKQSNTIVNQNDTIVRQLVEVNSGIRDEMIAGNRSRELQTEVFKTAIETLGKQKSQDTSKSTDLLKYTFIVAIVSLLLVAGVVTIKELRSMPKGLIVGE